MNRPTISIWAVDKIPRFLSVFFLADMSKVCHRLVLESRDPGLAFLRFEPRVTCRGHGRYKEHQAPFVEAHVVNGLTL